MSVTCHELPHLFNVGAFQLASRRESGFKINCDALTPADWEAAAVLAFEALPRFGRVEGVPSGRGRAMNGAMAFAAALSSHLSGDPTDPLLLAEDVWTTGGSMEKLRAGREAIGVVLFARGPVADWVTPLFILNKRVW